MILTSVLLPAPGGPVMPIIGTSFLKFNPTVIGNAVTFLLQEVDKKSKSINQSYDNMKRCVTEFVKSVIHIRYSLLFVNPRPIIIIPKNGEILNTYTSSTQLNAKEGVVDYVIKAGLQYGDITESKAIVQLKS